MKTLEGVAAGALIASGLMGLSDNRITYDQKLLISAAIGGILGYEFTDSVYFSRKSGGSLALVDTYGAIAGGIIGLGVYSSIKRQ